MNITKKIRKEVEVEYSLSWDCGIEIKQIREDLDDLEKLGATHIQIESHESYGNPSTEIYATTNRLETDEEFEDRLHKISVTKHMLKTRELERLKELKLKYEI